MKITKEDTEILITSLQPRDESTMAMVGSELYIMGGIGAHTVFLLLILILFQTIIVIIIMWQYRCHLHHPRPYDLMTDCR